MRLTSNQKAAARAVLAVQIAAAGFAGHAAYSNHQQIVNSQEATFVADSPSYCIRGHAEDVDYRGDKTLDQHCTTNGVLVPRQAGKVFDSTEQSAKASVVTARSMDRNQTIGVQVIREGNGQIKVLSDGILSSRRAIWSKLFTVLLGILILSVIALRDAFRSNVYRGPSGAEMLEAQEVYNLREAAAKRKAEKKAAIAAARASRAREEAEPTFVRPAARGTQNVYRRASRPESASSGEETVFPDYDE